MFLDMDPKTFSIIFLRVSVPPAGTWLPLGFPAFHLCQKGFRTSMPPCKFKGIRIKFQESGQACRGPAGLDSWVRGSSPPRPLELRPAHHALCPALLALRPAAPKGQGGAVLTWSPEPQRKEAPPSAFGVENSAPELGLRWLASCPRVDRDLLAVWVRLGGGWSP